MIVLLLALIFYSSYVLLYAELYVNNLLTIGWQFFAIYVITIILFLVKYRKKTLFNPEFLFSIVFLFCTFLYLPLLYNSGIDTFIFQELSFESNLNLIRSQSIAALSIQFYLLGAVLASKKKTRKVKQRFSDKDTTFIKKRKVFHAITTIIIILSMIGGGWKIIYRYTDKSVGLNEIGGLFSYITIFLVVTSVLEFLYLRKKNVSRLKLALTHLSRLYLFNILFMTLLYLFAGYRSAVFPLLIPVVFLYDVYVKKINKAVLITMFIGAFVLMSVMKETRAGKSVMITDNIFSVEYIGGDFTSANKAMYYLIDHTDKHGSQQGQNAILQMVSFIPFAQNILINFFGFEPSDSSSRFVTEGLNVYWSGLGTHVVGDLYYSFGLLGALFCMFIFGFVTSVLYLKSLEAGTIKVWEITVYLLILGNSIMFSRVEFFYFVRNIGFAIIIIWLFNKLLKLKRV